MCIQLVHILQLYCNGRCKNTHTHTHTYIHTHKNVKNIKYKKHLYTVKQNGSKTKYLLNMTIEDQQDATIRCLLLTSVPTCFGHHYAHLQEIKGPVTAFGVLQDVSTIVLTSYKTAPHNRYQPHPAEPEQHTKCSNRAFDLLKMGIMMAETC